MPKMSRVAFVFCGMSVAREEKEWICTIRKTFLRFMLTEFLPIQIALKTLAPIIFGGTSGLHKIAGVWNS